MKRTDEILVDFCLPIRNEALILENSLNQLLAYCEKAGFPFAWRLVGVVNGTSDNSVAILKSFGERHPGKAITYETVEAGRGQALKKYWLSSEADVLCYMDCDLATSLENIPALVYPIIEDKADLVVGSRLSADSSIKRSFVREVVSQSYNFLSRSLLGHRFVDLQCGFKAIGRESFHRIAPYLLDGHWFFDTEMMVLAGRFGFRIKEVPVEWQENRHEQKRPSTVKVVSDSWFFLKKLLAFRKRLRQIRKHQDNV